MGASEAARRAFAALQRPCVGVVSVLQGRSQTPLCDAIDAVQSAARALSPDELASAAEYASFPLLAVLDFTSSSAEAVAASLECLALIARSLQDGGAVRGAEVLREFLMRASALVQSPVQKLCSEDVQGAALRAVLATLCAARFHPALASELSAPAARPLLGSLLSAAVSVVRAENAFGKDAERVRTALHVIDAVKEALGSPPAIAPMFPGVASALCRAAAGDFKHGASAVALALSVLADLVAFLFRDDAPRAGPAPPPEAAEAPLPAVDVTEDWLRASAASLRPLLERALKAAAAHERPEVRKAAAGCAGRLLETCPRALAEALPALVHVLASLLAHEEEDVRGAAREALGPEALAGPAGAAVEEGLASAVVAVTRTFRTAVDDRTKLQALLALRGYLELSRRGGAAQLAAAAQLDRVVSALLQAAELQPATAPVAALAAPLAGVDLAAATAGAAPPRRFRHFADERIAGALRGLLADLAAAGLWPSLLDLLLPVFRARESPLAGRPAWRSSGCWRSRGPAGRATPPSATRSSPSSPPAPTSAPRAPPRAPPGPPPPPTQGQGPGETAIALELLGALAAREGAAIHYAALPLLMEKACSPVPAVADAASRAAQRAAGPGGVELLVRSNADYLVDHLASALQRFPATPPAALPVLRYFLSVWRPGADAALDAASEELADLSLDCVDGAAAASPELLRAHMAPLHAFLLALHRDAAPPPLPPEPPRSGGGPAPATLADWKRSLVAELDFLRPPRRDPAPRREEPGVVPEDAEPEPPPPPPPRTRARGDPPLLKARPPRPAPAPAPGPAAEGAAAGGDDRGADGGADGRPGVVEAALETLEGMAVCCGDFLADRMRRQLLPALVPLIARALAAHPAAPASLDLRLDRPKGPPGAAAAGREERWTDQQCERVLEAALCLCATVARVQPALIKSNMALLAEIGSIRSAALQPALRHAVRHIADANPDAAWLVLAGM
eukprot:tig00022075_g23588.t1